MLCAFQTTCAGPDDLKAEPDLEVTGEPCMEARCLVTQRQGWGAGQGGRGWQSPCFRRVPSLHSPTGALAPCSPLPPCGLRGGTAPRSITGCRWLLRPLGPHRQGDFPGRARERPWHPHPQQLGGCAQPGKGIWAEPQRPHFPRIPSFPTPPLPACLSFLFTSFKPSTEEPFDVTHKVNISYYYFFFTKSYACLNARLEFSIFFPLFWKEAFIAY